MHAGWKRWCSHRGTRRIQAYAHNRHTHTHTPTNARVRETIGTVGGGELAAALPWHLSISGIYTVVLYNPWVEAKKGIDCMEGEETRHPPIGLPRAALNRREELDDIGYLVRVTVT